MNYRSYFRFLGKLFSKKNIVSMWAKSVFDIDYDKLWKEGVRLIVFDVDDTLAGHRGEISEKVSAFLKKLTGGKNKFRVAFFSNCSKGRTRFLSKIGSDLGIFVEGSSSKPSPKGYARILKHFGFDSNEAVMVGDRVGTDLAGACFAGFKDRILVERFSNNFDGPKQPRCLSFLDFFERFLFL